MSNSKQKLTVNLTSELVDALRQMADRHGNTVTDELKRAIEDRKFLLDKIDEGDEVVLENSDSPNTKRIVNLRR